MSEKHADDDRDHKSNARVRVDGGPDVIRDRLVAREQCPAFKREQERDDAEKRRDQPRENVAQESHVQIVARNAMV